MTDTTKISASIQLPRELAELVDDALAKVHLTGVGTVGAMKWLASEVAAQTEQRLTQSRAISIPEGYAAVLVPERYAPPAPDYDECIRQADIATGLQCQNRSWLSIFIREVNRWCAQRHAESIASTQAKAKHAFRCETDDLGQLTKRCRFCGIPETDDRAGEPCQAVVLHVKPASSNDARRVQLLNQRIEAAHKLLLELAQQAGVGDGTPGWIEHHDPRRGMVRDSLSFEGELLVAFDAVIEKLTKLDNEAKTQESRLDIARKALERIGKSNTGWSDAANTALAEMSATGPAASTAG